MRIGLIGAGAVASLHARAAGLLPDVQMTAVCDLDAGTAAAVAAPIGAQVFTDYRDLLASGTTDAVIVNTPHSLHVAMAVAACEAGQHLLVEKPMAITLEGCDAMIAAATQADVTLRVGHIQHFLPDKLAAAAAISAGSIGRVLMIHDFRATNYRPGSRSSWFLDPTLAGGGAVMNIGAHCLDRITWLGGASAASVAAHTYARFGAAVETDASIALELTNGVTATATVVSDVAQRNDLITVIGEEGSLVVGPAQGALLRRDGATDTLHVPTEDDIPNAFHAQLADFLGAVASSESAVSQQHSRHVVELVLASYASAGQGGRRLAVSGVPATSVSS